MDGIDAACMAWISIVRWRADQRAIGVEQPAIHAPRVDADAHGRRTGASRRSKPCEDLAVLPERIPPEALRQFDRLVREPVDLLESERVRPDLAEDDAPARGTEIHRCDRPGS